jgi:LacI family transcriptional regulator
MRDVARVAHVSVQTVSLVVNGKAEITDETRSRVQSVIDQLGYHPHAAAQSLRSGRTGNIGLLVPDLQNPFFWEHVQGVEEVARRNNYSLFLTATGLDPDVEIRALRSLMQQRVDGLIVILSFPDRCAAELEILREKRKPTIGGPGNLAFDEFTHAYARPAREMMAHLLALGHRRIGLINSVARPDHSADRVAAYRAALNDAGIAVDEQLIVRCRPALAETYAAGQRLLDLRPRPTAMLGICDLAAFGAREAALSRGLRVPEDVSIAGFDDVEQSAYMYPGLTTVRGGGRTIGTMLATMLLERIAQPDLPPRRFDVPVELVLRGSTGPCPPTAAD